MNTNGSHLKRPVPARTAPIRNRLAPAPRPVPAPQESCGPAVMDALENGVRTAYAVIDDYMRRGQETARGLYNNTNRGSEMNDNRGNYGNRYNPWGALPGMEQWMAMMRAWTDAWSAFLPGGLPQQMQQMWNTPG